MKALFGTARVMLGASVLIALSACNSSETSTAPAENTQTQPDAGKVVFSEAFSDSGMFQIHENGSGGYNSSVQARIGSQAEKLLHGSSGQPTLAGVYSSLRGGSAEIPALVAKVSEQLKQMNPPVAPALPDPNPAVTPGPALAKTGSYSDFYNQYCRDFREPGITYKLVGWDWWYDAYELATWANTADRIFGWNNTRYTATMRLSLRGAPSPNTWKPTIPPYTVYWVTWGGTYTKATAHIELPSGGWGELGITEHSAVADPPR